MPEEGIVLTPSSITGGSQADIFSQKIEFADDDPALKALNLAPQNEGQPKTEPVVNEGTKPSEPKAETQPATPPADGTPKPEIKPDKVPYTEDELKSLVNDPRFERGEVHLDTSRIPEIYRPMYLEFQRGMTKKREKELEDLRRQQADVDRKRAEIAAAEERQRQLEEQKRYEDEVAQLGEEEARRNQRERLQEAKVANLESLIQKMQWKEASNAFRLAFKETAPKFNLPDTQEYEDMVMSHVWAQNRKNQMNGEREIGIEDGIRAISELFGFTNHDNLEKIIGANASFREAYNQKVIADYLKNKAAGATVPSSSNAPVAEKPVDTESSPFDAEAYRRDPGGYMASRVNKIFEEKNLKVQ
jgi:hypothetical protein